MVKKNNTEALAKAVVVTKRSEDDKHLPHKTTICLTIKPTSTEVLEVFEDAIRELMVEHRITGELYSSLTGNICTVVEEDLEGLPRGVVEITKK